MRAPPNSEPHRCSALNWDTIFVLRGETCPHCQSFQFDVEGTEVVPSALATQVGGGHYKGMAIQPLEYCHANNIGKIEGDVIAYVSRWRLKGGIEDLHKSVHELRILIELEERRVAKGATTPPRDQRGQPNPSADIKQASASRDAHRDAGVPPPQLGPDRSI